MVILIVLIIGIICIVNNKDSNKKNINETDVKEEVNNNDIITDEEINTDDAKTTYHGSIAYSAYDNIDDYFTYTIPEKFEKVEYSFETDYELNYVYDNTEDLGEWEWNKCEFELNFLNVDDHIDFMKSIVNYYKLSAKAKLYKTKINNITWYYTKLYNDTYYYATSYKGQYFFYHYGVNSNIKNGSCSKYHNEIINSIKFK